MKLEYNLEHNRMERLHFFGCAPYEREISLVNNSKDKGSHLTVSYLQSKNLLKKWRILILV